MMTRRFLAATVALALLAGAVVAQQGQGAATRRPAPADTARANAEGLPVFEREVFTYVAEGRRDPFLSLIKSSDLRPLLSDLRLVAVAFDPSGRNSVAIMRDVGTKDQYRVRVGQTLGRMIVAQIQPKAVTFTLDEFGYRRQETLALGDSTLARTP